MCECGFDIIIGTVGAIGSVSVMVRILGIRQPKPIVVSAICFFCFTLVYFYFTKVKPFYIHCILLNRVFILNCFIIIRALSFRSAAFIFSAVGNQGTSG